jgi:hypothetical protein
MAIFSLSSLVSTTITIGTATIEVDGITTVSPINSRTITQHPIEEGFNISDAQHQMPVAVTFKAWITDNPQSVADMGRMFTSALSDNIILSTLANATGLNLVEGNVKKQLAKLEAEANKGGLVTVKTKYAKYDKYYCVNFSYEETTKMGILISLSILEKQDNSASNRTTVFFASDKIGLWS